MPAKDTSSTGNRGEQLAEAYLIQQGYVIMEKNWRFRRYEIDIIASRNGMLHIVEVKCRLSTRGGYPEEQVNKKKFTHMQRAADAYMIQNPQWSRLQFDIISVILNDQLGQTEIKMIEDVYFWDV